MNFYWIQLFVFMIYSFLFYIIKPNLSKTYFWLVGIQLVSIMGLRSFRVGTDTLTNINSYLANEPVESDTFVYDLLRKISWFFAPNDYHVFLFLLSTVTVSIFLYCVYSCQHTFLERFLSIYLYITLYFYFASFNVQRQMLAVMVAMLIPLALLKKQKGKAGLFFLLALGIHNTSIIAILDFLVVRIRRSKHALVTTISASILLIYMSNYLFSIFSNIFDHYKIYDNTNEYTASGGSILLGIFIFVFISATLIINKESLYQNAMISILLYLSLIATILYILGAKNTLVMRMADYYSIFVPLFLPKTINVISEKFTYRLLIKLVLIIIIMLTGFCLLYYKLSHNMGGIVPYSTL